MRYLTKKDLIVDAFERLIDESSKDEEGILDDQVDRAIEIVETYIGRRYDVTAIFDDHNPIRNEVLISIISRITLYKTVRRNAARKVPADYKEDYDDAMEDLEKINTGRLKLEGLPLAKDDQGNVKSTSISGNNSNKDFYI